MTYKLSVTVTLAQGTDPNDIGERLFDLLAGDPDDIFPEIVTVYDYDVVVME